VSVWVGDKLLVEMHMFNMATLNLGDLRAAGARARHRDKQRTQ